MRVDARCAAYAAAATALMFSWQWATVHANYGGNWTALYCTGARFGVPASLACEHIYQFPDSWGYDGQMYHYVAHDPLIRTPDLLAHVDTPWLRYRRVLLPGLAWLMAMGQAAWVDPAYYALILAFTFAGAYYAAAILQTMNRAPAWGLLFLLLPATVVSMDRMTVDVVLTAIAAAFVWHARSPGWRLFVVLACAALARETGFLLLAAYCVYLLMERKAARAALYSLAAFPAVAWYACVWTRTPRSVFDLNLIPLAGVWSNFRHPAEYPAVMRFAGLAVFGDRLALIGMLAALALALSWNLKRRPDATALASLSFAAVGMFLQNPDIWANIYAYGRVYSPLLLLLGIQSVERKSWLAAAPLACMLPRIGMQLGGQIMGIFGQLR